MLTFIFAVTIPAPFSAVPARLAGWAFAAVVGIGAQLLWPSCPDTTPPVCRHIAVPRAIASTGAYANDQSARKR